MRKYLENWQANDLLVFFTIVSLFLSSWIQYIQFGKINIDSVLYFESAKSIIHGNWQQALEIYNWPFYSACIVTTHWMTGLNIEHSAQLLNVIFFGITTFSFLKIISLAGGEQLEIVFGAFVLFSARHIVGEMLGMQMRDEGFWSFYLTGIAFFIRFIDHQHYRDALLWQICILIAMLFRVEAIGYLLLLPLTVFFIPSISDKWRTLFKSYAFTISLVAIITLLAITSDSTHLLNASRLQEIQPTTLLHDLTSKILEKSTLMAKDILGKYLGAYAVESLLASFFVIIVFKCINTIGLINLALVAHTFKHRSATLSESAFKILIATSLISVLNLMFIATRSFVLVGRYTVAIGFILLIFASFSIRVIVEANYKHQYIKKALVLFLALFVCTNLAKNLRPELKKTFYLKEAAIWVNTSNKEKEKIFYDDILTRYYAGETYTPTLRQARGADKLQTAIQDKSILSYKYLFITINGNLDEKEKLPLLKTLSNQFQHVKKFDSHKNNVYVVILENIKV